jgi:hypothetical protein
MTRCSFPTHEWTDSLIGLLGEGWERYVWYGILLRPEPALETGSQNSAARGFRQQALTEPSLRDGRSFRPQSNFRSRIYLLAV